MSPNHFGGRRRNRVPASAGAEGVPQRGLVPDWLSSGRTPTGPTGPDRTRQLTSMGTVRKTRQSPTGHPTGYDRPRQPRHATVRQPDSSPTALRQDPTDPTVRAQHYVGLSRGLWGAGQSRCRHSAVKGVIMKTRSKSCVRKHVRLSDLSGALSGVSGVSGPELDITGHART